MQHDTEALCPECGGGPFKKIKGVALHRARVHGYVQPHGTTTRYVKSRCRCEACREAMNLLVGRKRRFLDSIKMTAGCRDCGRSDGRLEFDHVDKGTKNFTVGALNRRTIPQLVDEILLCEVRCSPCHHRRHRNERTACFRGHAFDAKNTTWRSNGTRACRACLAERERKVRQGLKRVGLKLVLRWKADVALSNASAPLRAVSIPAVAPEPIQRQLALL